jgi:hypothetical protein
MDEGESQDYTVAEEYRRKGVEKRAGDYIYKVLCVGDLSARPLEFVRSSEIDLDAYQHFLYSTLSPILEALGLGSQSALESSVSLYA